MAWPIFGGTSVNLLVALCLTCYLSSSVVSTMEATRPVVTIPQGELEGIIMYANDSRKIYGFTGIPYAEPPLGDLRFKAPVAPTPWNGTYDASSDGTSCLQISETGSVTGDEDCLYLEVYTPKIPKNNEKSRLLPVMFFIVGGGFKTENNTRLRYGPDYLLEKDMILVVPIYRVGVLGFLSTGDEVAPGNFGMKDIVMALQWTQDNIKYFGGDPNRVTLAGGSSGAMAVSWLALSNATQGLFHRYITQSGSAMIPFLQEPNSSYVNRALTIAEHFGCPTNTSTLLVECLRGFSGSELVDTDLLFYVWRSFPSYAWWPTVEPDIDGAIMTESPAKLMARGDIRDVPWINSDTRDEGLVYTIQFYQDSTLFEEFLENIDIALPLLVGYAYSVSNVTAYTDALKSYYLNDLTANRSLLLTNLTILISDVLWMYPAYAALQQRLSYGTAPAYSLSFEHRGVFSYTYYYSGGFTNYTGVVHADEVIYLFRNKNNLFGPPWYRYSEADWTVKKSMVEMWTSFVIDGEPTPAHSNGKVLWEPYSYSGNYLCVGNGSTGTSLEVKYHHLQDRMYYLDELAAAVPWK